MEVPFDLREDMTESADLAGTALGRRFPSICGERTDLAPVAAFGALGAWLRVEPPPAVKRRDSEVVEAPAPVKRTSAKDGSVTKGKGVPADIQGS